ncbi:hypothetical protein C7999DRAFT_32589 [Corynascus novoguineensis]|uniref:F-box domain-containing protein n=1 Tax=Corynascus novoguineensis TaxID=1126955 RepID=A0AAN7HPQ0_9PEZI|nr:hypothetical protein C7999DRAFT_32589 [Corynascus novoguineensis]
MAQEAPEAQTEDKTDPYNVSYHHLGSLPSELFDKILFEINSIRDLAHFIATARFVYQRFRQIDHADVFITRLCLAVVHHSPQTADGAPGIPPRQFDELFAHLHRLIQFLQTHRSVAERAAHDLAAAMELAHCTRLRDEYVNPYQMTPLRLAWQADRATSFPDPVTNKWDRDGLVVPYVGDGLYLAPYGWLDALGGRYVKWFGEGLYSMPRLPTGQSHSQSSDQGNALYLWRHAGFCLWDRKRVEALKGLSMFGGELYTGWVFNRLIERDD